MIFSDYIRALEKVLHRIETEQAANIAAAADIVAAAIAAGGVVHIFGAGHSHIIAEEAFYRAGGLTAINPILDPRLIFLHGVLESTRAEREPGYAATLLAQQDLRAGDAAIVVSNSGRNPVPIEMALGMKQFGLPVVAITNLAQSRASKSRHHSGLRLFEIADVAIDNCVPTGDACVSLAGIAAAMAPASTVAGAAIIHSVMLEAASRLLASGSPAVVLPSANVGDDAEEVLRRSLAVYAGRIRHLDVAPQ